MIPAQTTLGRNLGKHQYEKLCAQGNPTESIHILITKGLIALMRNYVLLSGRTKVSCVYDLLHVEMTSLTVSQNGSMKFIQVIWPKAKDGAQRKFVILNIYVTTMRKI